MPKKIKKASIGYSAEELRQMTAELLQERFKRPIFNHAATPDQVLVTFVLDGLSEVLPEVIARNNQKVLEDLKALGLDI